MDLYEILDAIIEIQNSVSSNIDQAIPAIQNDSLSATDVLQYLVDAEGQLNSLIDTITKTIQEDEADAGNSNEADAGNSNDDGDDNNG